MSPTNMINWQDQNNSQHQVDVCIDNYDSPEEFADTHSGSTVLMYVTNENYLLDGYRLNFFLECIRIMKRRNQTLILFAHNYFKYKHIDFGCQTIYYDWFVRHIYDSFYVRTTQRNTHWNPDNSKFIFLTGALNKIQRCKLLYKLHEAGALDHAIYSCFYKPEYESYVREIVPEVDPTWFAEMSQSPDVPQTAKFNTEVNRNAYGSPQSGFPGRYAEMATQSKFAVVSESDFNDYDPIEEKWHTEFDKLAGTDWVRSDLPTFLQQIETEFPDTHKWFKTEFHRPHITEKTLMPIVNRLPFIIAGDRSILLSLQEQGYVTYDQFLKRPYDLEKKWERILAVTDCATHWLELAHNKEIEQAVEHNYQNFMRIRAKDEASIMQVCEQLGLDPTYENGKRILPVWSLYENKNPTS